MPPVKPANQTIAKLQHDILARLRTDIDNLEACVMALDVFDQPVPDYDSSISRFSLPAPEKGCEQPGGKSFTSHTGNRERH